MAAILGCYNYLFPCPPGRGGAGARFPRPAKRLRVAPAPLQRPAEAASLLHSLLHPRGLTGWSRRRERGGEGRDWEEE